MDQRAHLQNDGAACNAPASQHQGLAAAVREWVASHDGNPESIANDEASGHWTYTYKAEMACGECTALLRFHPGENWAAHVMYWPFIVPRDRRAETTQLLALMNAHLLEGSLDLCWDEGKVRIRTSTRFADGERAVKMIDEIASVGEMLLETRAGVLVEVAFGGTSATDAFARHMGIARAEAPVEAELAEGEPKRWDQLPGADCVRRWAAAVLEVLQRTGDHRALRVPADIGIESEWLHLGRGVMLLSPEVERGKQILRRAALDAGMRYLWIPAADVLDLPVGSFNPFEPLAPVMVHLEHGPWAVPKREGENKDSAKRAALFRQALDARARAFDPARPVLFAIVCTSLEEVGEELRGSGSLDRRFVVPQPPVEFLGREFIEDVGADRCSVTMHADTAKVGRLVREYDSKRVRDLAVLALRRLARRAGRMLEFVDLVDFRLRGTADSDPLPIPAESIRQRCAWHEAGHTVVALVDSQGSNVPDYASILAAQDFHGITVESYGYLNSRDEWRTWRHLRHSLRISLAGRAAEELTCGREGLSTGCESDLEQATSKALLAFTRYGFDPDEDESRNGRCLTVFERDSVTPSERARAERVVRHFLAREYKHVLDVLEAHRQLLEAIADRLLEQPVLNQQDVAELWRGFRSRGLQGEPLGQLHHATAAKLPFV